MVLHPFRDGASDVYALTLDRTGQNLPCTQESDWTYLETLDRVKFAWGEDQFGEVDDAIATTGFFMFEGEAISVAKPNTRRRSHRRWRS